MAKKLYEENNIAAIATINNATIIISIFLYSLTQAIPLAAANA